MNTQQLLRVSVLAALMLGTATVLLTAQDETAEEDKGLWQQFLEWREERIAATDTYQVSTAGAGYAAIQDTRMTPVVYRAPGFTAVNQTRTYRPKETVLTTFFFQFAYPLTEQTIAGEATYTNPRGTIDWAYLRRIGSLPLTVGGSLSWSGNLRVLDSLGNSALNYDLIASLNPTARWEDDFTLFGRASSWHAQVTTPVVSWVLRVPQYNLSFGGNESFWAAPWKLYRLRLNVGLSRLLKHSQENRFTIDYFYDIYGTVDTQAQDQLVLGNHTIVLGYALKSM
jgi:hypothetical protein